MFSIPLQYALVIAIAISQTLGGGSCCCVGRAVISSLVGEIATSPLKLDRDSVPEVDERQIVVCPKCRARVAKNCEIRFCFATDQRERQSIGEDEQCRCSKLAINANVPKDSVSLQLDSQSSPEHVSVEVPTRNVAITGFFIYEVPIRFGGHSWQSIACTWKI